MEKKDCPFCDKHGLMILPLRYSVAVADDVGKELSAIPALPGHVGDGVRDLSLTQGKYVPAMLRAGYLYVLIERKKIKSWEGYLVTDEAYLFKFPVENPPVTKIEFTCDPTTCGIDASMVSIDKASDVEKVYFLFTPSPLTKAKLKEYKADADGLVTKKKMQVFNPKAWLAGTKEQPHALDAPAMRKHTVEWILFDQGEQAVTSALGKRQANQLFPPLADAYGDRAENAGNQCRSVPSRLAPLHTNITQRQAAGFVIHDPIGITQELNDFRNDALERIQTFLDAKDAHQISNERKYAAYEAIQEVKNGFLQSIYTNAQDRFQRDRHYREDDDQRHLRDEADLLRRLGHPEQARTVEGMAADRRAALDKEYAEDLERVKAEAPKRWKKYARLLNQGELDKLSDDLHSHIDQGTQTATIRADDHLAWLRSERLLAAFDAYDDQDQESGLGFHAHGSACTFGMGGIDQCADQLDQWIAAKTIGRENLFMRAFAFNQRDIQKEVEQTLAEARAAAAGAAIPGNINWSLTQKTAKGMITAFKSIDSAWDEYLRNRTQRGAGFKYQFEATAYGWYSEVGRSLFRKGLGNKGDTALVAGLGAVLYGRTGNVAEKLRMDELMYRIDPESPLNPDLAFGRKERSQRSGRSNPNLATTSEAGHPRQINPESAAAKASAARGKVAGTIEEALKNGKTSNYHQVRVGAVVTLLEAINLSSQLYKADKTSEDYLKMSATACALVSASTDIVYTGAKLIRENASSGASRAAISGAAETMRGGLKLVSGVFSVGAGAIGAVLDYWSIKSDIANRNVSWLTAIASLRVLNASVLAGFSIIASFSYCGTLVSRLSLGVAEKSSAKGAAVAAGRVLMKLGQRVALLRWVARFNLIGLGLTVAEIGVRAWILDDALESWCKRCVFRNDKSTGIFGKKPFDSQDEELNTLFTAYQEVN